MFYSTVAAVYTLVGQLNFDDARCMCVCVYWRTHNILYVFQTRDEL